MPHYNDEQKAIAVGAVQRFGLRPAERWLAQEWPGGSPTQRTLIDWARAGVVVTEEADVFLSEVQQERKAKWQAGFDSTRDKHFNAIDTALDAGKGLVAQQLMTSAGIAYDKLVPIPRSGAAVSIGGAGQVNIMVAAPANVEGTGQRPVPDDWEEGEVVSGDPERLVAGEK
jgi:hypothetical protein